MRVLIVDDDERVLSALKRSLSWLQIEVARSREEAAHLVELRPFDLAIVDLRLGPDSGLDVIRSLSQTRTMVVAISGYLSAAVTVAAVRAGASFVLPKPITGRDIIQRVHAGQPAGVMVEIDTPSLADAERQHIERVVEDCGGNLTHAARRLRVVRSTLQRKLSRRG